MEGRSKKSVRNIGTGFAYKIITFLFAFATRTIFIRLLGAEYTGVNGLYSNILQVLSLADLGVNTVLTYSLYQALSENRKDYVASIIHYYRRIYIAIPLLCDDDTSFSCYYDLKTKEVKENGEQRGQELAK